MNARPITYHRPRPRRRAPAVVVGVVGLGALVAAQLALALWLPDSPDRTEAVAAGPTAAVTADPSIVPTAGAVDPSLGPSLDPSTDPAASAPPTGTTAVPSTGALPPVAAPPSELGGRTPVPTSTVVFQVGAVIDQDARARLDEVLAVLGEPGAAPVLLTGSAEPGGDEAAALRLAQQRADAVAAALVEAGAPASLLRTAAVVDGDAGRTVVVSSEVP